MPLDRSIDALSDIIRGICKLNHQLSLIIRGKYWIWDDVEWSQKGFVTWTVHYWVSYIMEKQPFVDRFPRKPWILHFYVCLLERKEQTIEDLREIQRPLVGQRLRDLEKSQMVDTPLEPTLFRFLGQAPFPQGLRDGLKRSSSFHSWGEFLTNGMMSSPTSTNQSLPGEFTYLISFVTTAITIQLLWQLIVSYPIHIPSWNDIPVSILIVV